MRTVAPIWGTPKLSLTTPLMAPESCTGETADERDGATRHATPKSREATVLCVFVFDIRDALRIAGCSRCILGYRKVGRRCEYLIFALVRDFQPNGVLARS